MAIQTLPATPSPDVPFNIDTEVRTITTPFGDGYKQEALDGINAVGEAAVILTWSNIKAAQKDTLLNFFAANAGRVFAYTLPDEGTAKRWRCKKWSRSPATGNVSTGLWTVTATLERAWDYVT